ncbi:MAG TPA: hypothetical protein VNM48_16525 [Chloroflexota bacterium]|nr:hypothetical protein [Chloroflexota bacterium]
MVASWNLAGGLAALVALLQSAPLTAAGLQNVKTGSPEGFTHRVSAYVAALPGSPAPAASGGLMSREVRYFIGIGYRVQGAEATAETTLCAVVDAFHRAFHTTYPSRDLGGVIDNGRFEERPERSPVYQRLAVQEFRIVPLVLVGTQQETFPL